MHSAHFSEAELACRCGCGEQDIAPRLLFALELLRKGLEDRPVRINSAFRCVKHNKTVGGAGGSKHLSGLAADIQVPGRNVLDVARVASYIPFIRGLGIDRFRGYLHVDVRNAERCSLWYYDEHGKVYYG